MRIPASAVRRVVGVFILASAFLSASSITHASERVFRIGTGGNAGTYLPIGTLLSEALNQYNNAQTVADLLSPELLMLAQRSNGSAANVQDIGEGLLESGLSQADVAHWAFQGIGPFDGKPRLSNLRAIGTLYFESLHLVASVESGIGGVADLVGQRVSVDEVGSGTHLDVTPILDNYGIDGDDVNIVYLKPTDAMDRLRQGQLDAFFIVAGYPVIGVSALVQEGRARVVPIADSSLSGLLETYPFFTQDTIPAGTYANAGAVQTLAVAAQWVVDSELDEALVYGITKALWSPPTLSILAQGHPKGQEVTLDTALTGLGIPLHPGARRFYRELDMPLPEENL